MTNRPDFHLYRRSVCRICGGSNLSRYLDLGDQPPSNSFIAPEDIFSEQVFPLKVYLCSDCGLSQLVDIVSAKNIFDDYVYLSSTSGALRQHYQGLVDSVLADFAPDKDSLMVDIGCNDGIMLDRYPAGKYRLVGIEPSSAGEIARKAGHDVVKAFFDRELGKTLRGDHGGASIITATNVFAHVDDIRSFAGGIASLLANDGVFIIEFPYLEEMLDSLYFDTVYHEHLSYLALTPLSRLFEDVGLKAFRVERVSTGASGPALRLFVCLTDCSRTVNESIGSMLAAEEASGIKDIARYQQFAGQVGEVKSKILAIIAELKNSGHRIGAFGAPAKGNTLLNYLGLTHADIVAAAENNELKINKLAPGSHIPIVGDDDFLELGISHALLLSWNYADFFLDNAEFIKRGGKFIVPLPSPRIVPQ